MTDPEHLPTGPLLLHVCCGPCAAWPLSWLSSQGISLSSGNFLAYFDNPNIHPPEENLRRRDAMAELARVLDIPLEIRDSCEEAPFLALAGEPPVRGDGTAAARCRMCYALRMDRAAARAKAGGFPDFSTTLLVSPWQDRLAICQAGRKAGADHGVRFIEWDFRPGYRMGQALAREYGLYRQRYCGCLPSLTDAERQAEAKKKEKRPAPRD